MTGAFAQIAGLTLRHIGRRVPAICDLSLEWGRGERLLLLGPSGSGKSTLALCLNGVIPHALEVHWGAGTVSVEGVETRSSTLASLSSTVGVLFQDPETQLVMREIDDELAFGLENHGIDRAEMETRIAAAREATGITGLDAPIASLSGGTKQRVSLAAILALQPRGIVLDEPTANLDPAGAREVLAAVAGLVADRDRSLLLIEHRLDDVLALIDRVAVLGADGHLALEGTPEAVFVGGLSRLDELGVWVPQLRRLAVLLGSAALPGDAAAAADLVVDRWPAGRPARPRAIAVGTPVLEARDLAYRYPNARGPAVDGISLTIGRGELLAVVGPNGAGKSTLGLLLADAIVPDRGQVDRTGTCAYVFQYPEHQFVGRTVGGELEASLRSRLSVAAIASLRDALLDQLGLRPLAAANPFSLSHGQKRRLSVATALAADPACLILDEPTFGQDVRNTDTLMAMLESLRADGRAIIVITHDLSLVADHATRVVALDGGALVFAGTPEALFARDDVLARCALVRPPVAEAFRIAASRRADVPTLVGLGAVRAALS